MEEVAVVPAGGFHAALEAAFAFLPVGFDEVQGPAAQGGQVFVGVTAAGPALVFVKVHICFVETFLKFGTSERGMSKTAKIPVIEQVAELALRLSRRYLAADGAVRSRHDFTQPQLMSCLVLRAYLKTTYRGVLEVLAVSESLRQRLGLGDKLPHYTTLQKFSARSQVVAIAQQLVNEIGQQAAAQAPAPAEAAMDATGLARTTVSDYYCSRRGRRFRQWVKVSVMVLCGSLLPLAVVVDLNPTHDCKHARRLLAQAQAGPPPARLYADSGYDAEWIHEQPRHALPGGKTTFWWRLLTDSISVVCWALFRLEAVAAKELLEAGRNLD